MVEYNKLIFAFLVFIILAQAVTIYFVISIAEQSSMALEISERTAVRLVDYSEIQRVKEESFKTDFAIELRNNREQLESNLKQSLENLQEC